MNKNYDIKESYLKDLPYHHGNSELQKHDAYDKIPPVTYAKGTIRRLTASDSRQVVEDPLGFGFVITDKKDLDDVYRRLHDCRAFLSLDILNTVYKKSIEGKSRDETCDLLDNITEEESRHILNRFMPSNYHWLVSQNGIAYSDHVPMLPRHSIDAIINLMSPIPAVRRNQLAIHPETGEFLQVKSKADM